MRDDVLVQRACNGTCNSKEGEGMHVNVDEIDVDTRRAEERNGFTNSQPDEVFRMLCCLRKF